MQRVAIRTRTVYLSGPLVKALLLGSLCTFLCSAALFPVIYTALNYYIYRAPTFHTIPLPMAVIDISVSIVRILLAVAVGLFFRKRLKYVDKPDAAVVKKRRLLFCALFGLWLIYYLSDSMQHAVQQAIAYVASLGTRTGYSYADGPLMVPLLCETVLNPWSLFAFVSCWGCLLLSARRRGKREQSLSQPGST